MAEALPPPDIEGGGGVQSLVQGKDVHDGLVNSQGGKSLSYSDKLKVNVQREERLKRDVLEIHLESDTRTNMSLDDEVVANLCGRIGIDLKSQVEAVQIMPGNSRKIFVWLKNGVNLAEMQNVWPHGHGRARHFKTKRHILALIVS